MVIIPGLSRPMQSLGKRITSWHANGTRLVVMVGSLVRQARCPRCARRSARLHGRYRRWVADSPCFGQPVTLEVEVRRFKCVNRRWAGPNSSGTGPSVTTGAALSRCCAAPSPR